MKIEAIKNFFLYTGERIDLGEKYEMPEHIALDLVNGGFAKLIENTIEKKAKTTKQKTSKDKKVDE